MRRPIFSRVPFLLAAATAIAAGGAALAADELDYSVTDPELTVARVDTSPTESFLSMRADAKGRLFVGGREGLFVYEPDGRGGFGPRRELYRFPEHTWVYDVEVRGNDLYVITVAAVYRIPDGAVKTEGLKPERILWGVPQGHVHQCFHEIAWGPEGDLYIAMGDPLWSYGDFTRPDHWGHWTFFVGPEKNPVPYTGVGGVFRYSPVTHEFKIVARGLRNSCGLAFDKNWNLFSNDNDHEGMPYAFVPGRMVHVTPHSDFSWPRGWMLSITPDRSDMLETMNAKMGRAGPVGQCYYGDTHLPERYRHNLLVARWCTRSVVRYPLERRGASFKADEHVLLEGRDNARPVGVEVGADGRVFVAISYMAHNDASPIYQSDIAVIARADAPAGDKFEPYDATAVEPERLFAELSHPSLGRRLRAHTELVRRGEQVSEEAAARMKRAADDDPAKQHLLWVADASIPGTADGRNQRARSKGLVMEQAQSPRPEIRLQAIRSFGEFFSGDRALQLALERALDDPDPQVALAALVTWFDPRWALPEQIASGPALSDDTYLRQAATLLLAERSTLAQIGTLCKAGDAKTRLAGVLAAGFRLTMPPATETMPEELPLVNWRTEDVYQVQYADEKVDLRDFGRLGMFTLAEHWKASKLTAEQRALFDQLRSMLADSDESVRLQAAHFLSLLNDPRTEPEIARVRTASERSRLENAALSSIDQAWVLGPFPDEGRSFAAVHPPETGAVDLSAEYDGSGKTLQWQTHKKERLFNFGELFGKLDDASCYAYCRLQSPRRQQAMLLAGSDDGIKIWHNGRAVFENDMSRAALPFQDVVFLDLQPGSNDLLFRVHNVKGECTLFAHLRHLGGVTAALPERIDIADLAERLKSAGAAPGGEALSAEFLQTDWEKAIAEGDAERGRKLFGVDGIGCAKCHAIDSATAVEGGPSLAGAGRRFTLPYLVESVLLPGKQVSPAFRASLVVTKDGKQQTGLVLTDTAEKLELLLPDAKRIEIAREEIETTKLQDISPMPQGVVKKPDELRDILSYLMGRTE